LKVDHVIHTWNFGSSTPPNPIGMKNDCIGNNGGEANDVGVISHKKEQIGGEKVY
jgi:hypothetical protein